MNLRGARWTPIHHGSILLSKQEDLCSTSYVEPAVNRQPGFHRELVEQITKFQTSARFCIHRKLLKSDFQAPDDFVEYFHENSKFHHFSTFW